MFQFGGDLVLKFFTVDGCTTAAGASRIAALNHEVRYYAVEYESIEVVSLSESAEVLARLGCMVIVKLDDDGALSFSVSIDPPRTVSESYQSGL